MHHHIHFVLFSLSNFTCFISKRASDRTSEMTSSPPHPEHSLLLPIFVKEHRTRHNLREGRIILACDLKLDGLSWLLKQLMAGYPAAAIRKQKIKGGGDSATNGSQIQKLAPPPAPSPPPTPPTTAPVTHLHPWDLSNKVSELPQQQHQPGTKCSRHGVIAHSNVSTEHTGVEWVDNVSLALMRAQCVSAAGRQ